MHKLIDYICEELEKLERKADKDGKLSVSEVQYGDMLAHFKKNLLKSEEMYEEMEEGGEYSRRSDGGSSYYRRADGNMSYARGRGRNARRDSRGRYARDSYSRGGEYSREGDYSREGNYSRDGGYSRESYSREGGYSYGGEEMVDELRELMEKAPDEKTRMEFEKMIQKMEQMR